MLLDLNFLFVQLLAGLSRAMVLFLLSAGLSLIFGVMNILNFAHATFWLLGGYLTYSVFQWLGGDGGVTLAIAIAVSSALMFLLGCIVERILVRRMYSREMPEQLLLTFALVLILGDVIKLIWGTADRQIVLVIEPVEMLGTFVNPYYFIIIGAGFAAAAALWAFFRFTRYGHIVRAAVYSRDMVSALGIPISAIYAGVFGFGIAIAGFAAGMSLPLTPVALGMDNDLIIQCFAVVVIGGFGSIAGTFIASIVVGVIYAFSILLWPDGSLAMIYLIVIAVLVFRPWGLLGTELRT
jgi:branched-chain amino acid transport system permease protein